VTAPTARETAPFDRIAWQPRGRPLGWWGMAMFIVTEAMLFGLLLFAYFYLRADAPQWPLGDVKEPALLVPGIRTVILLGSSIPAHLGLQAIKRGRRGGFVVAMATTFVMATVFFAGHVEEAHAMWTAGERPDVNAYLSAFWTVVNFHAFHLLVGMALIAGVLFRSRHYSAERHLGPELVVSYWHFVDLVWVFVFSSLYLSVSWGG